jgi:2-dehydro-3-deoxyphosphooctonate aldolase (KDO 8-P synthase)
MPLVFKASWDKANRTSSASYRGPGLEAGLAMLETIRSRYALPVVSDVHEVWQVEPVAAVVDLVQVPAFLCRQTDLLAAAGCSGKPVNIKKGQFLAPADIKHALEKVAAGQTEPAVLLTERGSCFGYHDLIVDFRALSVMRDFAPVLFDATHAVQRPGAAGGKSGGDRRFVAPLARAAVAAGVDGIFCEVHPDPGQALSDAATCLDLAALPALLAEWQEFGMLARSLAGRSA